jgi:hypothetical protein
VSAKYAKHAYLPWKVYHGLLREGFKTKIIEIHDALGRRIVIWGGFDGTDYSYTQSLKNARRMVKAVNGTKP